MGSRLDTIKDARFCQYAALARFIMKVYKKKPVCANLTGKSHILTPFKHFTMNPDSSVPASVPQDDYRRAVAAKDMLQGQLDEALELLALRNEQIEVQRQKLSKMAQLQSQLDNMRYEVEFLQNELDEQRQKTGSEYQRAAGLMDELRVGDGKLQQYGSLQEEAAGLRTQVGLLRREADELAALNAELLQELKQVAQLQSSLAMEKQENRILREKMAELEKRPMARPDFLNG
jgi:uncharacterized membrane-anchored protein YhcB (DUF1043 family)